jgi:hypothetical protein
VHGINVWRIEEEGEEKKKEQNIGQYTVPSISMGSPRAVP